MSKEFTPPPHSFLNKFRCAFRGIAIGSRRQSSFVVHLIAAAAVIGLATWLRVSVVEWCILALCIAMVMSLELFNSSLEAIARAVDRHHNENLGNALDIASGSVLVGAAGAAVVGCMILLPRLLQLIP